MIGFRKETKQLFLDVIQHITRTQVYVLVISIKFKKGHLNVCPVLKIRWPNRRWPLMIKEEHYYVLKQPKLFVEPFRCSPEISSTTLESLNQTPNLVRLTKTEL